jgi:hypothetical protein
VGPLQLSNFWFDAVTARRWRQIQWMPEPQLYRGFRWILSSVDAVGDPAIRADRWLADLTAAGIQELMLCCETRGDEVA